MNRLAELYRRGGYQTWGMGKLYHAKLPEDRAKEQWDKVLPWPKNR